MMFEEWAEVIRTQVADGSLSPDAIAAIALVEQFDQLFAELVAESAIYQAVETNKASPEVRSRLAAKHQRLELLIARSQLIIQKSTRKDNQ